MDVENIKTYYAYMSDEYPINIIEGGISNKNKQYYDKSEKSGYYLFEYIAEGKGVLAINDKSVTVTKGDMYIISKNQNYECFSDYEKPYVRYWFFGYGKLIDSLYELYFGKKAVVLANADFKEDFSKIFELMQTYENTKESYVTFSEIIFKLTTKAKINESIKDTVKTVCHGTSSQAGKIKSYIFSNCINKFSLDELSIAMSLSKNQIINVFKKSYGITPQVYYMRQKLEFAEILLKKGKNCREVSEYFNFCDEQYFTKMYKRYKGISPSEIKK